jgi:hypothetical protein
LQISEHVERLVQLIHGDEPKIADVDDEVEMNDPEMLMGTKPRQITEAKEDSDDEDMRIEEI